MDVQAPSPQTTLLILLGASEWPFSSEFQSSEAFANAARRLRAYFLNPRSFGLPAENLLDLFDSNQSADDLDREIEQFLDQRISRMKEVGLAARDLVVYFVGHGSFAGGDAEYYLAIRRTRAANPTASSIQIVSLAHTLKEKARYLRRIVILDCCFAASAFNAFQATPAQAAITQTLDAFKVSGKGEGIPGRGTSLLCSSRHNRPSLLLPDGSSTMFSKALLEALATGNPHRKGPLSLQDVASLAEDFLRAMATKDAPRPEVHSPDQSEGDIAQLPFFPNPVARATGASANAETSSVAEKPPQPIIHRQPSQARPNPPSMQTQQQPYPSNAGPGSAPATNQSPTTAFSSPRYSSPSVQNNPQGGWSKTRRISLLLASLGLLLGIVSVAWQINVPYINYFLFYSSLGLMIGGWIGDLIQTYQLKQWRWFLVVLWLSPLAAIAYGLFGPTSKGQGDIVPRFIRNASGPKRARRGFSFFLTSLLLIGTNVFLIVALGVGGINTAYRPFLAQTSTADSLTQTATDRVTATALAREALNIYTQATNGTPVLSDTLQSNSSGWDKSTGCIFLGGAYHAIDFQANDLQSCYLSSRSFSNFAFQVNMKIVKGDAGGVLFRADKSNGNFYFLQFSTDGSYSLNIDNNGNYSSSDLSGSTSANMGIGQTNTITVVAEGGQIYIYINHQYVNVTNDTTYSSGLIAVVASTSSDPADVAFSNAKVWILSQPV